MPGIVRFRAGDTLELKKPHPCGGRLFAVLRGGSEAHIVCKTCGRDVTVDRLKLEKNIKKVIAEKERENESAPSAAESDG